MGKLLKSNLCATLLNLKAKKIIQLQSAYCWWLLSCEMGDWVVLVALPSHAPVARVTGATRPTACVHKADLSLSKKAKNIHEKYCEFKQYQPCKR